MAIQNNLRKLLSSRIFTHRDKIFLYSEKDARSWSYGDFGKAVNRTANMQRANGISKGDVVSLLLPNSAEYVIAYFACFSIGAIAGPINSLLKPEEVEWVIGNSESKLLLAGSQFEAVISGIKKPATIFFDDETQSKYSEYLVDVEIGTSDDAIIIYTSGTTGKPKGCLLTHGNLIANARQITEWLGFTESDRLLTIMPLFHMNAVSVTTMTALYSGASTVVSPKFSVSKFWDIISNYRITSFGSVATMLSMLLSEPPAIAGGLTSASKAAIVDPKVQPPATAGGSDSLRFAMCGSAPVPAEILKKFEKQFNCLVIEGYGLSESTCRSTFNPPNENHRPGSCGQPIGNEMKIFDETDNEVAAGELGEIVMRGPNIFKEYYKNPEATAKAFTSGWFHTGDIGYRDADGFFYIADRKSDMIIRGGENIYPREIDDVLYTHSAVASAAVIGVPDELYGEEVTAFVVLKAGKEVSEEELITYCGQHLADFKCPKSVHFVDDIPKGPTGKLLKRELAKL